jgi:AraC-like DNA-binding protein
VKVVAGILSLKPIVSDVEVPGSCLEGRLVLPAGDDVCLHAAPAARETRPPPEHPFHGANRQSLFRRMSSRLRRVTNWAELAEESSYSAKILADRCGVSLRQLERYIPRVAGKTPQRWLNELRQQKAMELIASGQSVKEVSFRLGYKQSSHFSREFKRFHGVAPSELPAPDFSSMSL